MSELISRILESITLTEANITLELSDGEHAKILQHLETLRKKK